MKQPTTVLLVLALGACASPEIFSESPLADHFAFEGSSLYNGRVNSVGVRIREDAPPNLAFHDLLVILFDDLNGDGRLQESEKRGYRAYEGQPTRNIKLPDIVSKEEMENPWFWAKVETNQGPVEVSWRASLAY